jgi:hypothetical protein
MEDIFGKDDLEQLLKTEEPFCLTLLMPATDAGPETKQNAIRFKNLVGRAEGLLAGAGMPSSHQKRYLEPLRAMVSDKPFWANQSKGLALFRSEEEVRTFRLPVKLNEFVGVGVHFHVKPLLPFLLKDQRFYVLALSQSGVRLLQCSRQEVREVEVEGMPARLTEPLKTDEPRKQPQFHTGTPKAEGSRRSGMFHGHGVGIDESKDSLLRFFRQVSRAVESELKDETAPMVLAGLDHMVGAYREINTYANLLEEGIVRNPEELSAEALQGRAWTLMTRRLEAQEEKAIAAHVEASVRTPSSQDLKVILPAAYHSRVDSLFVAGDTEEWGVFDPETGIVTVEAGSGPGNGCDLLNLAARHTLLNGGAVHVLPRNRMPKRASMTALFRY